LSQYFLNGIGTHLIPIIDQILRKFFFLVNRKCTVIYLAFSIQCSSLLFSLHAKDIFFLRKAYAVSHTQFERDILIMLPQILFLMAFCYPSILISSGIVVGKVIHQIYVPLPPNDRPAISFNYSIRCDECLCYAFSSTTIPYVVLNCLANRHVCWFYTNYTTNYSFQWNSTRYLYFFQLPPHPMTTISSTTTTTTVSSE
jgi:hypothetical protein